MPARTRVCLLAGLLLAAGAGDRAQAGDADLEPVPPMIAFPDLSESEAARDPARLFMRKEIGRAFVSLSDVELARRLLVHRFGLISAPELGRTLANPKVQAESWNALLTVGALRDVYGPAPELDPLLKPLHRLLTIRRMDFHTPAFAALAAGCFHWPQARLDERRARMLGYYDAVPGVARTRAQGARELSAARTQLVRLALEKPAFLQVAALLALAKMGGAEARTALSDGSIPEFRALQPARARLLARAFLEVEDPGDCLDALHHEDRRIRATAALAVAVAVLGESPAAWTAEPETVLEHLRGTHIKMDRDDGPETVFARGALALRRQVNEEWAQLWRLATLPSSERRVAEAAAQTLLFCEESFFDEAAVRWALDPQVTLKESVLALVLLRAGMQGTERAIEACERWLKSKARRPVPSAAWDPRWYAAIGLLRALNRGHVKVRERRARVIKSLEFAVGRGRVLDREAPFHGALTTLLEAHGRKIAEADEKALYLLPDEALRGVEASVRCPHALLARDAVDACVRRVNDMVQLLFGLDSIDWSTTEEARKEKQPEKYLKRYLDAHPYFSRLEFRDDRGLRPALALPEGAKGIDR